MGASELMMCPYLVNFCKSCVTIVAVICKKKNNNNNPCLNKYINTYY